MRSSVRCQRKGIQTFVTIFKLLYTYIHLSDIIHSIEILLFTFVAKTAAELTAIPEGSRSLYNGNGRCIRWIPRSKSKRLRPIYTERG